MDDVEIYPDIDLEIAFETFRRLEVEGGDVGGLYWAKVATILRESDVNRRLLAKAQKKLLRIQDVLEQ